MSRHPGLFCAVFAVVFMLAGCDRPESAAATEVAAPGGPIPLRHARNLTLERHEGFVVARLKASLANETGAAHERSAIVVLAPADGAVVGPAALELITGLAGLGIVAGSVLGTLAVALAMAAMAAMARRVHTVTLLVLGLMLGFFAQGLISVLLHFTNHTQSRLFSSWNDATFASVVWPDFATLLPPLLVGLALAVWLSKPLTALLLGETYAESLGVDVPRLRRLVLAATILLAAPVTAFCGPVAFIGLITPHLARGLIGSARIGALVPATLLLGALLALAADFVVHLPWNQYFLHLNAILAILGAPVVIVLLLKSRSLRAAGGMTCWL